MNKTYSLFLVGISFVLTSCAKHTESYTPPSIKEEPSRSFVLEKNFDETWRTLVSHSGSAFYDIEGFEKDSDPAFYDIESFEKNSGLLTFSFESGNPELYITGGHFTIFKDAFLNPVVFEGDWVEYMSTYYGTKLTGKMNLVVRKLSPEATQVTVNTRFIFTDDDVSFDFNSGSCEEINLAQELVKPGSSPIRRVCSTYKAESHIAAAFD